ncbi:MAG: hypothetical protein Q8L39_10335 [Burkholderiales bacterium]|nr:hypothetical protein [Burkholderiales bacterium]
MGIFNWFSGKAVDDFAKLLVQDLAKRYPSSMESGNERKISPKGISNILEAIYQKAIEFKIEKKLGVYRTAKLSNTFRWELKELGYSENFIEVATEGLVVYLTRKAGAVAANDAENK